MATTPYPYYNPKGLLFAEGFNTLLEHLPPLSMFQASFNYRRKTGQNPHDRYSLEYEPNMQISEPWRDFIQELCSDDYRHEIARLLGVRKPKLRFHWHYTPQGCSVSPHCDARNEGGSHLFNLNTEANWHSDWGGATLILDDGKRLDHRRAVNLEDFDAVHECEYMGNYSLLIQRSNHGWHAVRPIACPENKMRRIFVVVVMMPERVKNLGKKMLRFLKGRKQKVQF